MAGPIVALGCYFVLPDSYQNSDAVIIQFTHAGRATLAMMVWMAIWWLSEAIDISATALLPVASFPLLGIANIRQATAPYADQLIFLFLGGFLLAASMKSWSLDRRIALMTLQLVGTQPKRMVAGFMAATAILSAFVSNTATTAMMLPIAMSVIGLTKDKDADADRSSENLATCLMLGIAYAASIGGTMTIIGTPPNVFLIGYVRETIAEPFRTEISFVRWLPIGVPLAIGFLPIIWFGLTHLLFPIRIRHIRGGEGLIASELHKMGRPSQGERITLIVFLVTAGLWITRPLLLNISWSSSNELFQPFANVTDAGIVMTTALLLFVIPVKHPSRRRVLQWQEAERIPWGVLILVGGGLSLAGAVSANGVAPFLGSQSRYIGSVSPFVLILIVTTAIVFLTELTSNIATTATLLPILAALAPGFDVHPYVLIFPAAIAASCAFMLPVATPPNAIVFASGAVRINQMIRAGFWFNLAGIALVTLLTYYIIIPWIVPS